MTTKAAVCEPTADLVRAACREFDEENRVAEETLGELFQQYRANHDLRHVLCKVVVLNRLYWTQILGDMDVALHINRNVPDIDLALASGSPEIVDRIAKVTIQGKVHNFFSFATKYSSWQTRGTTLSTTTELIATSGECRRKHSSSVFATRRCGSTPNF